uniref:DNA-directed DNA polymerase n=1 Tax=Blastobotrys adeninivorans TaxID=409370 RepID=A0A060T813_BLAAD
MTTSSKIKPDESLLKDPNENESYPTRSRVVSKSTDVSYNSDFLLDMSKRQYGQQFANLYYMRLEVLKPRVMENAKQSWEGMKFGGLTVQHASRILDIRQGNLVWIVGTIYKDMKYKPNVLEDVSANNYGAPPIRYERYFDKESDKIMVEDESGRIEVYGDKVTDAKLVTGVVVALLGTEDSSGGFDVLDLIVAGFCPQVPRPIAMRDEKNGGKYLAIVSGLMIGSAEENQISLELLQEYLSGELGASVDQERASEIARVIIAGNSMAEEQADINPDRKKYGHGSVKFNAAPLKRFDALVSSLAMSMPVSIMPGDKDPSNASMPQQPLHKSLLHNSRRFMSSDLVTSVTNPYWWDIDGVKILGTSGNTIEDIYKYDDFDDRLAMMESTLRWQHAAPTAPDTLWSYPFSDKDPFIVSETPHIYFAGNQKEYSTRIIEEQGVEVRLVTVPEFYKSGQFVLVDLETLDTQLVQLA